MFILRPIVLFVVVMTWEIVIVLILLIAACNMIHGIAYFTNTNTNTKKVYDVQEFPDFLTGEECDYLINMCRYKLFPSKVYGGTDDNYSEDSRKSEQCWLEDSERDDTRGLVKRITEKVSALTNSGSNYKEALQVVNYTEGGYFKPHYDACNGSKEYCERMDGEHGPRLFTLLIYLNDDYEGGGTQFPYINKTVKPQRGKAVLFYNVDDDGKIIYESLHGGDPVTKGKKWIANKWVRVR